MFEWIISWIITPDFWGILFNSVGSLLVVNRFGKTPTLKLRRFEIASATVSKSASAKATGNSMPLSSSITMVNRSSREMRENSSGKQSPASCHPDRSLS